MTRQPLIEHCGRSSAVEHHVANVRVVSSNLIARYMKPHIFENTSFLIEISPQANCQVAAKVTIKPEETKQAYKKAVKSVNKQISIPGFRKGKAPDDTVISRYSSYIEGEWKDSMVRGGVQAAFDLTGVYPIQKELLSGPKLLSCDKESGAVIEFTYERYPEVPEIDFKSIQLPAVEVEPVKEDQVEGVLTEVRKAHASYETLDKAIESDDYAKITVKNVQTGADLVKDRQVCVNTQHVADWLYNLLLGLKAGDVKSGRTEGANPLDIELHVHAVEKIVLPPVNEELAKKVGADSLNDLMTKINKNLESEAQSEKHQKQIVALEDVLLASYSFDIPQSMKTAEKEVRMTRRMQELKQTESEDALEARKAELEKEIDELVDKSLRLYFISRQIAKQGKIQLTQDEINRELSSQIMMNPAAFRGDMDKAASERILSQISATLMERKIKEYALSAVLTN